MKKLNVKNVLFPVLSLVVICCVVSALLAVTNAVTKSRIEQNEAENSNAMRYEIFAEAKSFESQDSYYVALNDSGDIIGYVFETVAKGYGGDVSVMTGIAPDGQIKGIRILSHSETPGLGANCTNEEFIHRYEQKIPENGELSVVKGAPSENGNIDAITGATITSKAVTSAVNIAISEFETMSREGD
ncbi:MAG: RnfABCDGE type electron transport complex subunit G [Clostridia bacterium]|nr:RnfABCDGE type electron transport complex subunit G [Clostridia bacterium]